MILQDEETKELFGKPVDDITIFGNELIDNFLIDLLLFISDHWVALLLLLFVIVYLIYAALENRIKVKKLDTTTKTLLINLRKAKVTKLTSKLFMRMGIIGGGYKHAQGDLYLIDTRFEEVVTLSRKALANDKQILQQKEILISFNEKLEKTKLEKEKLEKQKIEPGKVKLLIKKMFKLNENIKAAREKLYSLENQEYTEENPTLARKKTDTYAMLTQSREIIALRRTNLSEQESLKSQAKQKKIIELDYTKTQKIYNYFIGFLVVYIIMVMSLLFTGDDGAFLIKFENLAFFILVFAIPFMETAIMKGQEGYALTLRATKIGNEVFKLYNNGKITNLTLPVFLVEIHWDEDTNIENTIDVNTEKLTKNVNTDLQNQVSYLSTEKANLEADNQMLVSLLNEKDVKINNMELKADQRYNDGLFDNITSKPLVRAETQISNIQPGQHMKYFTIIVLGVIISAVVLYILNSLTNSVSGTSTAINFDLTVFAIWGLVIGAFLLLLLSFLSRAFPR